MGFVPLIIDSAAEYAWGDGEAQSVLSLPLGVGTVLGHVLGCVAELKPRLIVILKAPGTQPEATEAPVPASFVRHVGPGEIDDIIEDLDSTDSFIVLDTKSWPVSWPTARTLLDTRREYQGATHAIAIGGLDRAIERIECDETGQVRRVHRLYATANWPEAADDSIAWSLVPARSLSDVHFESLSELREGLTTRGVLSRDKPVTSNVINLTQAKSYLSLCERVIIKRTAGKRPPGFAGAANGTLLGRGSRVSPSARLVPPVIVREGAVVSENAIVVGPSIIGANGEVQAGAVVAQSVVLPGAVVPEGCVLRQQVYRTGSRTEEPPEPTSVMSGDQARVEASPEWNVPPTRVFVADRPGRRSVSLAVKRIIDIVGSGSALIVLSPLLLLISLLIKLDSRGPVLFGHLRERRGGKEFRCWKFRTMVPDADSRQRELFKSNLVDGPQFKMTDDPRVTRVGRWLRATNLDELPQLINVLIGQMSLVGPRPSPFRENQICVAWRQARLSVRPGITGLWQICRAPDRSQGDFHEWIYYDLAYVRRFSLWLDLRILFATIITLGGHRRVSVRWVMGRSETFGGRRRRPSAA